MRSYIPQTVLELIGDDIDRRIEFAEEWIRRINIDPLFWRLVLWSDEAIFKWDGHVNRHDNITWSDTNPRKLVDRPFQSPGVMVWPAVFNDRLIGLSFDNGTITGDRYLNTLENYFWPEIAGLDSTNTIFFQQDGASPHYKLNVREWLNEAFDGWWIGRRGTIEWPHWSPDLTPPDFWLWGYLKKKVYSEKPRTIDDLKRIISEKMAEIPADMIECVCESVTARMRQCIELEGAQIIG